MEIRLVSTVSLWGTQPFSRVFWFVSTLLIIVAAGCSRSADIVVTNPASTSTLKIPIVIVLEEIPSLGSIPVGVPIEVIDETGSELLSQADDLDGDGMLDEVVFFAAFEAQQSKLYRLRTNPGGAPKTTENIQTTDAKNWKRVNGVYASIDDDTYHPERGRYGYRYDGVGWESEIIGYRLYLDERNAFDIFGKKYPLLILDRLGKSTEDYQADLEWGMDILHVGSSFGFGGFGIWDNGVVYRPDKRVDGRCRVIARGPVRSVVRVDYEGWYVGDTSVNITSIISIYAGERWSEIRLLLRGGADTLTIATGIVKNDSARSEWNENEGWLLTEGRQSRRNDGLTMILHFEIPSIQRRYDTPLDYGALLTLRQEKKLRYYISSIWDGEEEGAWRWERRSRYVSALSKQLNTPLRIQNR